MNTSKSSYVALLTTPNKEEPDVDTDQRDSFECQGLLRDQPKMGGHLLRKHSQQQQRDNMTHFYTR